jgi:PAS domain-containing protein
VIGLAEAAWGFWGVVVTQVVIVVTLITNRRQHTITQRQLSSVEHHVNNVEEDISDESNVTLGQRLKRMEAHNNALFEQNAEAHARLARGIAQQAIFTFQVNYESTSEIAAMVLRRRDDGSDPPWWPEWVNHSYTELVGLTLEQAQQQEYIAGIHPDDLDRVMLATSAMMREGRSLHISYRYRRHPDEPYFRLTLTSDAIESLDQELFALLITFRRETL